EQPRLHSKGGTPDRGGGPTPHLVAGNFCCRGPKARSDLRELMGFEVDFLPVRGGEESGEAIAVRCRDLAGPPRRPVVLVIDGGTIEGGERLVEQIKTHYQTSTVDLVVNTHPDGDHSSGLAVVLEELKVGHLWMHRPWEHSGEICEMFKDGTLTNDRLS